MTNIMRSVRAFTIIELLIVIVILGILVLLAAPKILGYTENAKLAHIKNDIKAYENAIGMERISSDEFIDGWETVGSVDLERFRDSKLLFDKRGVAVDSEFNDDYLKVPSNLINSKLKGDFILAKGGMVFYHDEGFNVDNDDEGSEGNNGEESEDNNESEDNTEDESEQRRPSDIDLGMESDFIWIDLSMLGRDIKGFFLYVGKGKEVVEIPHIIQGVEVTSYFLMFSGEMITNTGADIKKVISTNKNVTDMSGMFALSEATSLDLSEFNTSNVEYMDAMFSNVKAKSLDLSSFDTSKVTQMNSMFYETESLTLDLSSFDTSNVTEMGGMFVGSKAIELNLSNFDTSKVTIMNEDKNDNNGIDAGMFERSEAKKIILGKKFTANKVENFNKMFFNSKVTEIVGLNNLNPSNATRMTNMFSNTKSLNSLDLSSFDTTNAIPLNNHEGAFHNSMVRNVLVRSQEDADRLDNFKPYGLTFTVKQ